MPEGLFLPNNHSVWQIRYKPLEAGKAATLSALMRKHFSAHIDTVSGVEQVDEAEVNSNNFKITGSHGGKEVVYLLRSVDAQREPQALESRVAILKLLSTSGVPLPQVLPAAAEPVIEDGRRYLLFVFIAADHYRGTREELLDCARTVAKLDVALQALSAEHKDDAGMQFTPEYLEACAFSTSIWQNVFAKIKEFTEPEAKETAQQLLERSEEILNYTAWIESQQKPEAKSQVAHFDLHPHNFLADGSRIVAVLDFDSLRYVEKMRTLSFATHRAVRQHLIYTGGEITSARIDEAKQAFRAAYREYGLLTDAEVASSPYFMRHEAMMRLTFTIKKFAETGVLVWKQDLPKQLAVMAEADYFS